MITIHNKFTRDFTGIGSNLLYPDSCTVQEELNGMFEMTLTHPYDVQGRWKGLQLQNIIVAPTPLGNQPFRIYKTVLNFESITVYAKHIFYDLLDNMAKEFEVNLVDPQQWLDIYKESLVLEQGFTFTAEWQEGTEGTGKGFVTRDMNGVAALIEPYQPQNKIQRENRSFISWFEDMTLIRDKWHVHFKQWSEEETGFCIQYGRNMTGLTVEEDISDIITRVYPRIGGGTEEEPIPPYSKEYIDSVHVGEYVYPKVRAIQYDSYDPSEVDDMLYEILVNLVTFDYDQKATVNVNINVNFQMLSRLEGYEKYKDLENVIIGDIVTIVDERTNLKRNARVISYDWDAVAQKYNGIELGTAKETLVHYIKGGSYVPSGL